MIRKNPIRIFALALILVLGLGQQAQAGLNEVADALRQLSKAVQETVDPAMQGLSSGARAGMAELGDNLQALSDKMDNALRLDFTTLVKKAGPAVVNISTERTAKARPMPFPFGPDMFRGDPFFDDFFGGGPQPRERKQASLGSGFIISPDGYIVTNNHVVEGAEVIRVNFDENGPGSKEHSYDAVVIGTDKETDLALLKIEAGKDLPFIAFGDSDKLEVGEWLVAIGNPFGLDHTVTAGILSAKFRNIDSSSLVRFLQTDASINPGNSGGPLLNMKGEVIGINTAIAAQGQGIGFAIPSTLANDIINRLKADKRVSRGWLGVSIQNVDGPTAKALGLKEARGALIGGVMPEEPAAKAGLEAGDVILKVDKTDIANTEELIRIIANKRPGDSVNVSVWRDGKTRDFKVDLAERNPEQRKDQNKDGDKKQSSEIDALGLELRPMTEQEAGRLRLDARQGGLILTQLNPEKPGAKAGLQRGDVILAVGRKPVTNVDEFNKELNAQAKRQGAVMLRVYRNGQQFMRAIEIPKQ